MRMMLRSCYLHEVDGNFCAEIVRRISGDQQALLRGHCC